MQNFCLKKLSIKRCWYAFYLMGEENLKENENENGVRKKKMNGGSPLI